MDSVYHTLLDLGIVYVRDDEALGEGYKVIAQHYIATPANFG
jgi:hypothetical protein